MALPASTVAWPRRTLAGQRMALIRVAPASEEGPCELKKDSMSAVLLVVAGERVVAYVTRDSG
ncbi:hypothetical protein GCM10011487_31280 [Steroidobacter agaridevorans]|uniref:Uncharacterized protein n=1 Tax=Steroidobacter agaridevorans TaxID=2695856 RepID=A0A829YE38_9GAMM|nr:hypothetical protein GCM10011487_31280 [Steroidobacter agaridevorans]GFE88987.1 hypothetical protein GCM10011488_39410 [Steroidobacter agaridevorans]